MQTTADKAKEIRSLIKKQFGFTNKDVAVRKSSGGYESAIHITAKTIEAARVLDEIETAVKSFEKIYMCERSGEVLSGGNTFIFCGVDTQLELSLIKQKSAEINGLIDRLKADSNRPKNYNGVEVCFMADRNYPFNFTVKNGEIYNIYDEYNFRKTLAFL